MLVNDAAHYNGLTALSSLNSSSITNVQFTPNQQVIATDNAGDSVIAWVGTDNALNPATESPFVNPTTGYGIDDQNIYARYLTNEVQNIDLTKAFPGGASQLLGTKTPTISLYFGQEVQTLSITSSASAISGRFYLSYNGTMTAEPIYFNSQGRLSGAGSNAMAIQNGLRALGVSISDPALNQVTVAAIDANDFTITFPSLRPRESAALPTYYPIQVVEGDDPQGNPYPADEVPLFQPIATDPSTVDFTGYPAAVQVVETSKAFQIGPIPISANNPAATANAIEQYFVLAADANTPTASVEGETPYAPISTATPQTTVPTVYPGTVPSAPNYPGTSQTVPASSACRRWRLCPIRRPRTRPVFIITRSPSRTPGARRFIRRMYVYQATSGSGTSVLPAPVAATIVKESSSEFRVNDPEPNNSSTPYPAEYDATDPQVAMDATGDFVITWQQIVPSQPGQTQAGVYTDIFARRFSPTAYVNTLQGTPTTFLTEETPYQPVQWRVSTARLMRF